MHCSPSGLAECCPIGRYGENSQKSGCYEKKSPWSRLRKITVEMTFGIFFQVARALNYYFEHINVIERLFRDERGREGATDAADLDRSPSGMCV